MFAKTPNLCLINPSHYLIELSKACVWGPVVGSSKWYLWWTVLWIKTSWFRCCYDRCSSVYIVVPGTICPLLIGMIVLAPLFSIIPANTYSFDQCIQQCKVHLICWLDIGHNDICINNSASFHRYEPLFLLHRVFFWKSHSDIFRLVFL